MTTNTKGVARFNFDAYHGCEFEADDGYYVLFTDHGRVVEELRAEIEQMRGDSARIDWLDTHARHYGDGYTEPREAAVGFNWQQTKDCQTYPGIRPAIDAAMKEHAE